MFYRVIYYADDGLCRCSSMQEGFDLGTLCPSFDPCGNVAAKSWIDLILLLNKLFLSFQFVTETRIKNCNSNHKTDSIQQYGLNCTASFLNISKPLEWKQIPIFIFLNVTADWSWNLDIWLSKVQFVDDFLRICTMRNKTYLEGWSLIICWNLFLFDLAVKQIEQASRISIACFLFLNVEDADWRSSAARWSINQCWFLANPGP